MKLIVSVDGKTGELRLDRNGDSCRFAYQRDGLGAVDREASILEVEPGIYSVLIGNRSYEVKIVAASGGYYVDLDGHRSFIEVRDPRTLVKSGRGGAGEGRQSVTAPMPGKVVRVLVEAGSEVQAGDGMIVVEAMKMQNEMKAPKTGRVVEVLVREGATVAAGEVLSIIE